MKTAEMVLFWIAVVALIGIGFGRFLSGPSTVMGFSAGNLISIVNTVLLLSIIARLRIK